MSLTRRATYGRKGNGMLTKLKKSTIERRKKGAWRTSKRHSIRKPVVLSPGEVLDSFGTRLGNTRGRRR